MVFNLLSQHDLDKSQLEFQYKEGVCSIVMKNIREPIMCVMVSEDDLYKMTYSDAEYLCNHLDTPFWSLTCLNRIWLIMQCVSMMTSSTLRHGRLIHMYLDTIKYAARHGHLKGLDKYLPNLSRQHFCRFCAMSKASRKPNKGHHQHD